jgi:hypothetical protein
VTSGRGTADPTGERPTLKRTSSDAYALSCRSQRHFVGWGLVRRAFGAVERRHCPNPDRSRGRGMPISI